MNKPNLPNTPLLGISTKGRSALTNTPSCATPAPRLRQYGQALATLQPQRAPAEGARRATVHEVNVPAVYRPTSNATILQAKMRTTKSAEAALPLAVQSIKPPKPMNRSTQLLPKPHILPRVRPIGSTVPIIHRPIQRSAPAVVSSVSSKCTITQKILNGAKQKEEGMAGNFYRVRQLDVVGVSLGGYIVQKITRSFSVERTTGAKLDAKDIANWCPNSNPTELVYWELFSVDTAGKAAHNDGFGLGSFEDPNAKNVLLNTTKGTYTITGEATYYDKADVDIIAKYGTKFSTTAVHSANGLPATAADPGITEAGSPVAKYTVVSAWDTSSTRTGMRSNGYSIVTDSKK